MINLHIFSWFDSTLLFHNKNIVLDSVYQGDYPSIWTQQRVFVLRLKYYRFFSRLWIIIVSINYGSCSVSFMMLLERSRNMLDHHKYTLPDQLVTRYASQAHSVDQTHPT